MQNILLFFLFSSILSLSLGCDTTSRLNDSQSESDSDYDFDDIVQTSPLFLCYPGELVVGTDGQGQPLCETLDGSQLTLEVQPLEERPVYFGHRPTSEFLCPDKSFLKGFDRSGRAICLATRLSSSRSSDWISEDEITQIAQLRGQVCRSDEFVIGYDEFKNIICGAPPQ